MSDKRAYTYPVGPFGSGQGEEDLVHQSSPSWVLTFVRWENRDTFRNTVTPSSDVRDPLVVENDCIQVTTTSAKSALTPSVSATLLFTDVNYKTQVAPGDFMIVNMLNWPTDARRVANNARAKKPINGVKDGFKGVFKVQSCRRVVVSDPSSGTKTVMFRITGFAFTEFNNTIYFNPYLVDPNQDRKNELLFASFIGKDWANLVNEKGYTNVQTLIAVLIQSFIGNGISEEGRVDKNGIVRTGNTHFFIPQLVGDLLGVKGAKAAKDVYNYLFGLQQYASGSAQSLADGMNPQGIYEKFPRFWYTPIECAGDSWLKAEYWNSVKTWSILNQYTNAPLNELYTCFRVSKSGRVMPTVVFRQIPFTNDDFTGSASVTKFMNLPRWKISPALVFDEDFGTEEAARINFVQYFGQTSVGINGASQALEIAKTNYVYDIEDVKRSGLRPYVVTSAFDEPSDNHKEYRSPEWAKILGDAVIGQHLRPNGTLTCAGIVDPIAVGDNVEFDGVVYHVEQVSHSCSISVERSMKMFRTTLHLTNGLSVTSGVNGVRYPDMAFTNGDSTRKDDAKNSKILPGVSESQDTVYRPENPDGPFSDNNPFPQPGGKKVK
jgi:hypothetical protein